MYSCDVVAKIQSYLEGKISLAEVKSAEEKFIEEHRESDPDILGTVRELWEDAQESYDVE